MALEIILDLLRREARITRPLDEVREELKELEEETIPHWLGVELRDDLLSHSHRGMTRGSGPYGGLVETMLVLLGQHRRIEDDDPPTSKHARFAAYVHDMVHLTFLVHKLLGERDDLLQREASLMERLDRTSRLRRRMAWPFRAIVSWPNSIYRVLMIAGAIAGVVALVVEVIR